jgi:hypothetical protein
MPRTPRRSHAFSLQSLENGSAIRRSSKRSRREIQSPVRKKGTRLVIGALCAPLAHAVAIGMRDSIRSRLRAARSRILVRARFEPIEVIGAARLELLRMRGIRMCEPDVEERLRKVVSRAGTHWQRGASPLKYLKKRVDTKPMDWSNGRCYTSGFKAESSVRANPSRAGAGTRAAFSASWSSHVVKRRITRSLDGGWNLAFATACRAIHGSARSRRLDPSRARSRAGDARASRVRIGAV